MIFFVEGWNPEGAFPVPANPSLSTMPRQNLSIGRLIGSTALATTLILGTLASSGCYRRVVGAKNAPGYTGPVYEENVKEGNESLFQTRTVTPKGSYYVD